MGAHHRSSAVAYLTNVYPKTSHSFIRTEIAALERQGLEVHRFAVRRGADPLVDPDDQAEAGRTFAILSNPAALAGAMLRLAATPARLLAAARLAFAPEARKQGLPRALAYLAEAALLAREMRRRGIRHVHVHFGTNPAAVARLAARMAAITYSVTMHGPDEFDAPVALQIGGKVADARFAVAVSSFGRGQLMRWSAPADWDRIAVVRCAVAPQFLSAEPDRSGSGHPTLVCVARLSAQKGIPLLIAAACELAARRRFTLRIIGDGEDRDALHAMVAARGAADVIHFLGPQPATRVRHEIAAARALVLPSFAEGLPVVLMEALAIGRPVIATAIAGVPELVDAANGWLIPSGSEAALVEAMEAALDAPDHVLAAMGDAGRAAVRRLHDPDRNARALAELLLPLT